MVTDQNPWIKFSGLILKQNNYENSYAVQQVVGLLVKHVMENKIVKILY